MDNINYIKFKLYNEIVSYIIDDFYGAMLINNQLFDNDTQTILIDKIIDYKYDMKKTLENMICYRFKKRKLSKYNLYLSKKINEIKLKYPEIEPIYRFSIATQMWQYEKNLI